MNKLLQSACLIAFLLCLATVATADSFTTSSCNVDFAVNDGGSFYVQSSQIPPGAGSPPGVDASSSVSALKFHLTAAGAAYSDSGIVLYFNGGLKLGDLQSVSVTATGGPVNINIWLDTGGDGQFFAFDSSGMMTGLDSDSYGAHSGSSIDTNSSFYMMSGYGAGQSLTLAQLQAALPSETPIAFWIGISQNGGSTLSADISSVAVAVTGTSDVFQTGGDRLVATQNTDGGWGWPLTGSSAQNTIGPIAMGLAKAYSHTGDADQRAALESAGAFLLAKTNTFSPPDGYLAAELDGSLGGSTYKNHVVTYFYNALAAGTYMRLEGSTWYGPFTTNGYITFLRGRRASIPNIAAWDLGMGLVGAASCGASTSEWISAVKEEINELDGNLQYDVIGLAGALYGLAFVGEDFDPSAGEHAAASSLNDLAAILAGYQFGNGAFPDSNDGISGSNQETSYSILALNEVDRCNYLNPIQGAANYLKDVQLATGGWNNESGGNPEDENNEVTGEALWGISAAVIDTDSDSDATPDCHDNCPDDPLKTDPGICGCGIADTDSDGDGTPNCNDGCPNDPLKIAPGICGCGVADTDSDGDGTPDCNDGCPNDPLKTAPGQCGCGIPDTDTDGDGIANCNDGCPNDPLKIAPGQCGCGIPDTDTDGDGVADCVDNCPNVSNPLQEDVDLDGIGDACDSCIGTCNVRTDTPEYFPTIQDAYTNAANGAQIQVRDVDFTEDLVFNRDVFVFLKGGYDEGFNSNPSLTPLHGKLTISNGKVIIENIVVQ